MEPFVPPVIELVVPDSVKDAWSGVKLSLENKSASKIEDIVINLNSEYKIAGSELKVMVGDFLPDFKMQGTVITSDSDNPNNPAVHVTVYEGEEEIFKGWLYSRFPAIHPFQHEVYGLTLMEGVKKKG